MKFLWAPLMIVHIVFVFQRVSFSIGIAARAFALLHHGNWGYGFMVMALSGFCCERMVDNNEGTIDD